MESVCEACEIAPIDVVEPCDNQATPYLLCSSCHVRLHAFALRPIEWYNLVKRHGWWNYHLHDDFYDEEGKAWQPECDVESPERYSAPTLQSQSSEPEALLDYTITRWHFEDSLTRAWQSLSPSIVLQTITKRVAEHVSPCIKLKVLDVACTLGSHGDQFVRYMWGEYPESVDLSSLAKASASCLPKPEGFNHVVQALQVLDGSDKRDQMLSLSYFHNQESLDWIEANIFSPVTESWGYLAAASEFDWSRARRWLELGRPMSLVALDAVAAIIQPQSLLLRSYAPCLHQPPDSKTLVRVLSSHAVRDSVPRVTKLTEFIIANSEKITVAR